MDISHCFLKIKSNFSSLTKVKVNQIFAGNAFDAVMHFAAVAYVGESTLEPLRFALLTILVILNYYSITTFPNELNYRMFALLIISILSNALFLFESHINISSYFIRYYHNITLNTLVILEAMAAHGVKTLIYSSTCATYGQPEKMPITEETPQVGPVAFSVNWLVFKQCAKFNLIYKQIFQFECRFQ